MSIYLNGLIKSPKGSNIYNDDQNEKMRPLRGRMQHADNGYKDGTPSGSKLRLRGRMQHADNGYKDGTPIGVKTAPAGRMQHFDNQWL